MGYSPKCILRQRHRVSRCDVELGLVRNWAVGGCLLLPGNASAYERFGEADDRRVSISSAGRAWMSAFLSGLFLGIRLNPVHLSDSIHKDHMDRGFKGFKGLGSLAFSRAIAEESAGIKSTKADPNHMASRHIIENSASHNRIPAKSDCNADALDCT